ncbi:hypothetical protein H8K20_08135 [Neobittarella massiliensis]|uniref:Uncharacterized protein n=1 Tax=Neobittarella massiliensis (ex Bilen et al. 2018) TaxID=2041842 RepID=A0A8J6LZ72_9FIRM|nr:hypothetical protein [Neobittarella massiliensis]MBC3516363.1 hypothetical protein [Neobittarella massiliensis]
MVQKIEAPASLSFGTPYQGLPLAVTCASAGAWDEVKYRWERSVDGSAYRPLGTTAVPVFSDMVPVGSTYGLRVQVVTRAGFSDYTYSGQADILTPVQPIIEAVSSDLGEWEEPIPYSYTIHPCNRGAVVTVRAWLAGGGDDRLLRQHIAEPGTSYQLDLTKWWLPLPCGTYILRIEASDQYGSTAQKTATFTRLGKKISLSRTEHLNATPRKVLLSVYPANYPPGTAVVLQASCDPYGPLPVWEDVAAGEVHQFTAVPAGTPGIGYRIKIEPPAGHEAIIQGIAVRYLA